MGQTKTSTYLKRTSWRIKENASAGYSPGAMANFISGADQSKFWLDEIYPKEVKEAHKSCCFHIHDLCMVAGYCNGWSLRQLLTEGLGGVPFKVSSAPAKHMLTAVAQIVNFLGIMSNESAGAQAFSSMDTYLAPFVKEDNLSYEEVKQYMQMLVFGLNVESRWAGQSPFSNMTFDIKVPEDMKDLACIHGGKPLDYTYSECQAEMNMINRAFMETMIAGDFEGRLFSYPIPTYNITADFEWDSEIALLLFKMTGKYGIPYFQNFLNSDLDPSAVRSMCCRLQLDKRELRKRGGGLFGADEFTGSIGVVTLNMPRLAYMAANDRTVFFELIEEYMNIAKESLEIKRTTLASHPDLFPYTNRYLKNHNNHFSTIGLVGMNEAIKNLYGDNEGTYSENGKNLTIDVLDFMREKLSEFQIETGNLYNLEGSPAEGTSYRLAKHDVAELEGCHYAGTKTEPYYTNSTQLPVGYTDDLFEAIELQEAIQTRYTGGIVFHGFIGEEIEDPVVVGKLVRSMCENSRLPYFTITPTFSVCGAHGYLKGEQYSCPHCESETEVYSRIVGYYRPVKNWNTGKAREWTERKTFNSNIKEN